MPQIDAPQLSRLRDADAAELLEGDELEGLRFADVTAGSLDLRGAHLDAVAIDRLAATDADLVGADLVDVGLFRADVPVVRAARGRWRSVEIRGRIGSLDAHDVEWRSVHFVGCKLGFVNLRAAKIMDAAFTDCIIEELDLGGAEVHRLALDGTRIRTLDIRDARLADVDLRRAELSLIEGVPNLRGATIGENQLAEFAPLLARELGLRVEG